MGNTSDYSLVHNKTGEIVRELKEGDRIISGKSIKAHSELEKNTLPWDFKQFAVMNLEEIKLLAPNLSPLECGLLFCIAPYMEYGTGRIRHSNGKPLNILQISEIFGMKRRKTSEIIHSLIEKGILQEGVKEYKGQYFVNPWLISRGKRIHRSLLEMFGNYFVRSLGMLWKEQIYKKGEKKCIKRKG